MKLLLITFFGIDLLKKMNFEIHITGMSLTVAKAIQLLYNLNLLLPATILNTL